MSFLIGSYLNIVLIIIISYFFIIRLSLFPGPIPNLRSMWPILRPKRLSNCGLPRQAQHPSQAYCLDQALRFQATGPTNPPAQVPCQVCAACKSSHQATPFVARSFANPLPVYTHVHGVVASSFPMQRHGHSSSLRPFPCHPRMQIKHPSQLCTEARALPALGRASYSFRFLRDTPWPSA